MTGLGAAKWWPRCNVCSYVALLTPEALLRVGLSPAVKVLDQRAAPVPRVREGKGEPWFRSSGGEGASDLHTGSGQYHPSIITSSASARSWPVRWGRSVTEIDVAQ